MMDTCDANVINVLIEWSSIESILLIGERSTANQVIVHQRPKGAKSAFTKEGDEVLQHAHYSNKKGKIGIIQESVESAIREEKTQLEFLMSEKTKLDDEWKRVAELVERNTRSVIDAMRKVKRKGDEKKRLVAKIEELKRAEEEEEPEEDIATYVRVGEGSSMALCVVFVFNFFLLFFFTTIIMNLMK